MAKKKICLALQGGGAHGAFTWGVLDGLLEEESLEIQAVSGTSAGAMNGAVMVDALKSGGRKHARERLERFWHSISQAGDTIFKPGRMLFPVIRSQLRLVADSYYGQKCCPSSGRRTTTRSMRTCWPTVIGEELPDFKALNDHKTPHLFVCATNVKTNQRKIFGPGELDVGALTASACLPTIFRSVEVKGRLLLGWWLSRQPCAVSITQSCAHTGPTDRLGQSTEPAQHSDQCARHSRPVERGYVQRYAGAGDRGDRCGQRTEGKPRRVALALQAHPPARDQGRTPSRAARPCEQEQYRLEFPSRAAGLRASGGEAMARDQLRRRRQENDRRYASHPALP